MERTCQKWASVSEKDEGKGERGTTVGPRVFGGGARPPTAAAVLRAALRRASGRPAALALQHPPIHTSDRGPGSLWREGSPRRDTRSLQSQRSLADSSERACLLTGFAPSPPRSLSPAPGQIRSRFPVQHCEHLGPENALSGADAEPSRPLPLDAAPRSCDSQNVPRRG